MAYSESYKENAFQTWYRSGRPSWNQFVSIFRSLNGGKGPAKRTFELWSDEMNWRGRANRLDHESVVLAEEQMVEERADMLNRHKNIAVMLQKQGVEYLKDNDLTNEHAALRAIESGISLERQVRGMPQVIKAIFTMSDERLLEFLQTAEERMTETSEERLMLEG